MHRFTRAFTAFSSLLTLVIANGAAASGDVALPVVGEITFSLGKAYISAANGNSALATRGMPIHAGDVIETTSGGHVHVRFIDNALMSVRPSSTLEIVRYDYNAQSPQNSAVKLNLIEGVSRAVSGDAAKQARQNFRMNTPIAAIGVRGTDFAVSANAQAVRAIVNEGAIVVAPFSAQCSADSLGPCSQDAVELSGLSRQMLELSAGTAGISSALLPASAPQAQALAAEVAAASANADAAKPAESKELYADTVTSRVVNTTLASSEPVRTVEPVAPVVVVPPAIIEVPPPEFTPDVAQAQETLTTNSQLVWGRWLERNVDVARITVPYEVAIQEGRQATIGNLVHALFRVEPAGKSLQPGLGVLAFDLTKAQAHYRAGGQISLMDVNGGQLSLDFNQSTFATSLQLSHAATGNVAFNSSGRIYDGGFFHNNGTTQSMAGAVSLDGKEAGYFFEKTLDSGSIEGLTLWGQKP